VKLSAAREAYYTHSGKASDVARSLAFAGIAVAWLFRTGEGAAARLDSKFLPAVLFLVIALALDLLQYVSQAFVWGAYHRWKERKLDDISTDPDVEPPGALNWPALVFFWSKFLFVIAAYYELYDTIWQRTIWTN
jgi:hypothetical protein